MTEIPKHLLRRAMDARKKATAKSSHDELRLVESSIGTDESESVDDPISLGDYAARKDIRESFIKADLDRTEDGFEPEESLARILVELYENLDILPTDLRCEIVLLYAKYLLSLDEGASTVG